MLVWEVVKDQDYDTTGKQGCGCLVAHEVANGGGVVVHLQVGEHFGEVVKHRNDGVHETHRHPNQPRLLARKLEQVLPLFLC